MPPNGQANFNVQDGKTIEEVDHRAIARVQDSPEHPAFALARPELPVHGVPEDQASGHEAVLVRQ